MNAKCDIVFDSQTVYDTSCNKFTSHCGICDKSVSKKMRWWRSREKTLELLQLEFSFCSSCGRWVCDDCFLISNGTDSIAVCRECAKKQGLTGFTIKQINKIK